MNRLYKWLWLTVKVNITITKVRQLIEYFGDVNKVYDAKPNEFLRLKFLDDSEMTRLSNKSVDGIEGFLEVLSNNNVKVVTIDMPEYPQILKYSFTPPYVLYCRGKFINLNDFIAISVVGTRKPSSYGVNVVNDMAYKLACEGIIVVSGMAFGIDSLAHKAALKAGMPTVAILGCGINRVYPPAHADLMCEIMKTGMVISEYPPNTEPMKHHFPERNRIIGAISAGTVVIEATIDSGSLITANLASEMGRDVFAVPGDINSLNSMGTNDLIKEGAQLITSIDEVIDKYKYFGSSFYSKPYDKMLYNTKKELGIKNEEIKEENDAQMSKYPKQEDAILKILTSRPTHIDIIASTLSTTPDSLSAILLTMELNGDIISHPGDSYSLSIK